MHLLAINIYGTPNWPFTNVSTWPKRLVDWVRRQNGPSAPRSNCLKPGNGRWGGDPADVVTQVNALGYGLTCGIQTRIDSRAQALAHAAHVGNIYINRNMIGAVVGVQPFGGEGLSGTGPKAGGPHYLYRFCAEQTITVNTTAAGGNAALLASMH